MLFTSNVVFVRSGGDGDSGSVYLSQAIVYNLALNALILRPGFNAVGGGGIK